MKIYSLSKVISLPFGIIFGAMLYSEFTRWYSFAWWMLIPLSILVLIYIFSPQIDYYWLKKHPIPLEDKERQMLEKYSPYYQKLSGAERKKFEDRVSLYVFAREWKNVGTKELHDIPDDVKVMLASLAIQMTFHHEDFLIGDYDRIYTYKHPFPTPHFQFLHTMETNQEDGVILLALEYAMHGITQPSKYYNIAMHAYAEAFTKQHPNVHFLDSHSFGWHDIEAINGFTSEQISKVLGYEHLDLLPAMINSYFTFPQKTKEVNEDVFLKLEYIFSNPLT